MKREKEVPEGLLAYLEKQKEEKKHTFEGWELFCTLPVRAVRMKMLRDKTSRGEDFCTTIVPATDVYLIGSRPLLKTGFLKRDSLTFYIEGTKTAFPYGHVYNNSGLICLGTIFVPSAIPERSPATPLETLFLHNDRNLNHGNCHLGITLDQEMRIRDIIAENGIRLSERGQGVRTGNDIIEEDEIWNLAADVAEQKNLPEALTIMSRIYQIIFEAEASVT